MYVVSNSFAPYAFIPEKYAFGRHDPKAHFAFAPNRNPHLAWGDVPDDARSLVVVCYDQDAPADGADVNQEGKVLPAELPRTTFFHWLLIDLKPNLREIREGMHCLGVTQGGKQETSSPDGGVQGVNDFTSWFTGQEGMEGSYHGYDGPAPPWNDARVHAYHFTVFALGVESLKLDGPFSGHKVMRTLRSHVLSQATHTGLYAINPDARRAHRDSVSA